MISRPLIVIAGVTGAQGSSVARYLLKDGSFTLRGLTSDPNSQKAKDLTSQGIEIVKIDLNNIESIRNAFVGAYGVFGVTNFWHPEIRLKETQHGKNMVDAAKVAGVKHFIWSTLDETANPEVPHWNTKHEVDQYLKASGVPRTSLYTSIYYENFLSSGYFQLKRNADGQVEANWPVLWTDGPIGIYAVDETGAYVTQIFKNPERWINQDLRVISEVATPRQIVKWMSEASGVPIKIREVSKEDFENKKDIKPEWLGIWANDKWFYMHNGNPGRDFELSKELNPQLRLFKEWAKEYAGDLIPYDDLHVAENYKLRPRISTQE